MVQVLGYILGFGLIGLLGWFAYNQISAMVVRIKERKKQKEIEKTQSDEKKEG